MYIFIKQFFTLIAQARAVSQSELVSFPTFKILPVMIMLMFTNTVIPRSFCCCCFYIHVKVFTKVNKFFWYKFTSVITKYCIWTKKLIQYFRNIFIIISVDLLIITALLNLEYSSLTCKYHKFGPNWCKSIATVSLK